MALRPCIVSFTDTEGLRHSVEVQAESLYEAAILALKVFQAHDCCPGLGARIEVEVRTAVTHTVTVQRIKKWLEVNGRSPAERLLRNRLRDLMTEVKV